MRVLLLHPDDVPSRGDWSNSRWDLIVDLGFAGASVYAEWSRQTGSRVITLYQFEDQEGYRWVKRGLAVGHGKLLDRMGLDWWEILAPCSYQEQQALYLVEQLRRSLGAGPIELVATRAHPYARALSLVAGWPVRYVVATPSSRSSLVPRVVAAFQDLRPSQVIEISLDKWDPKYNFRKRVTRHRRLELREPVVLLPSAYSNVTRTVLAYATQLRDRRFLLATTRRSGESEDLPANVSSVPLSAYAEASAQPTVETAELLKAWSALQTELGRTDELGQRIEAGVWNYVTPQLEIGLRLRDAWHTLMSTEPVSGVFCGDDLNYHTRLPLILAKVMGLRAVYCAHGALDGGLLFKRSFADLHLVKGEMERDYLLEVSDIVPERVEIAAPAGASCDVAQAGSAESVSNKIVFFSQPYEVSGGRGGEIYGEILRPLLAVAKELNRKIIVKLHPFESVKGRTRLVKSLLSAEDLNRVEITRAPASDILPRTFLGIGLDSSVAVECAQRQIPYFMCGWLDFNGFGYMRQFDRFGVGVLLDSAEEVRTIPRRLGEITLNSSRMERLFHPAANARLDELLFGTSRDLTSTKCAS